MMHINCFAGIQIAGPLVHRDLAMFPLVGADTGARSYLTLDEAVSRGALTVTEVSAEGRVPELLVSNHADVPVFLLDGEELVGAMQNRMLNLSILVPAGGDTRVPVSCVEAGRWRWSKRTFTGSGAAAFSRLRAEKGRQVSDAMAALGERRADQAAVWEAVACKMAEVHCVSPTQAMADLSCARQTHLDAYCRALAPRSGQRGAVFAVGGRIAGMDIFDRADTLASLLPKLVRSYALDSLEESTQAPPTGHAETFLCAVEAAFSRGMRYRAVGLGQDVRFSDARLNGAALEVDGHVLHLCAFLTEDCPGA